MWDGLSMWTKTDKDYVIDCEDGFLSNHVPHLSTHRDGGGAKLGLYQAHLNEVSFDCGSNEVDLGDDFGHDATISELQDGINRCFFIDSLKK